MCKVLEDHLVLQDQPEPQDQQVLKAPREMQDHKVLQDHKDQQDLQESRALREIWVRQDLRGPLVSPGPQGRVSRVILETRVHLVCLDLQVLRDPRVQEGLQGPLDLQDRADL